MATSSDLRSRVTEIATCPICLEDFKDPRSLPCVHSFCLQCLQDYCKDKCPGDDLPCPLCRKEFQIPRDGVEALPHNFFLQNLVDAKTTKHQPENSFCEPCCKEGRTKPAAMYCVDCSQNLCTACSVPHKNWRGGAHDVRAMGEELSAELIWMRGSYCDKHPDKRMELYCVDCRRNICMKCSVVSHKNHQCEEVEKVAEYFAKSIQSDIKPFHHRISEFREAAKQVELANEKFLENVKSIELRVQEKGDKMKRLVDDHVAKLMQELDEGKTSLVKETKTRVDRFELVVTALESFEAYASELTSSGSACDITRSYDELRVRAKELLKTPVTSSSDRVFSDIEFVATGVEQITGGQNIIGSLSATGAATVPAKTTEPPAAAVRRPSKSFWPNPFRHSRRHTSRRDVETVCEQYLQSNPQVVHTFPKAEVVCGVTLLNNELYVLRGCRNTDQVDVYTTTDFTLLRPLNVSGLGREGTEITSCVQKQCVYIADFGRYSIHRAGLDESVSKWPVKGRPRGLSVTRSCNLLVTCCDGSGCNGKLVELSSKNGKPVREIMLSPDINGPRHGVQLANSQFVVCHAGAVSLVGSDGRVTAHHRGDVGLSDPSRVAVDDDEFVFVADDYGKQIVLFDPSLNYVRHVLQDVELSPWRLCFDDVTRRLYVGETDGIVSVVQL